MLADDLEVVEDAMDYATDRVAHYLELATRLPQDDAVAQALTESLRMQWQEVARSIQIAVKYDVDYEVIMDERMAKSR